MADDEKAPSTSRLRRTTRIGGLVAGQGGRYAGGRMADTVRSDDGKARAQSKRTAQMVEQIVTRLGEMKGAAMKVGQVLSTVEFPGMEPDDSERIQEKLASLRDSAPAVSFAAMEKLMAKEWGEPVKNVLADIDPDAMAAASIGQVYRAKTRDGRDVAIKVQYPGIAEAVDADLRNLRMLMPLLGRIAPGLDTKALADELRERISEELDYELEGASHRRIHRMWRNHPHLIVPAVDTEHSTRRVLVTELVECAGFESIKREPDEARDRLGEIVHRFYYSTAADHNTALGDPHPGNWGLHADGRAVMFDFGMLRQLPDGYVRREGDVIRALHEHDPDALFTHLFELGYLSDGKVFEDRRDVLFEYMFVTSKWIVSADQPLRLTPDVQRDIAEEIFALEDGDWRKLMRGFSLPSEAVLLRRMADLLFISLCQLRVSADWWALAQEVQMGREPSTVLGREHAAWRGDR